MGHFMTLIDDKMHLACYNAGQGSVSPQSRKLFQGPQSTFHSPEKLFQGPVSQKARNLSGVFRVT